MCASRREREKDINQTSDFFNDCLNHVLWFQILSIVLVDGLYSEFSDLTWIGGDDV